MTAATETARGPGRPSSGARERLLDAATETLLAEGYAGLSYAKVAVRAGENKSMISYYFGSKQGVVASVADLIGEWITAGVLEQIRDAETVAGLVEGLVGSVWDMMDEDPRLARLYFDLSAVSVVEADVRSALVEVKGRWREVLGQYLARFGVPATQLDPASTYLVAGVEGLAIERLERDEPTRLEAARGLFVEASSRIISGLSE
ncbi:MAG: TetR/AcrR family transcriptional regulator [Solirubrobacterales bacterium]